MDEQVKVIIFTLSEQQYACDIKQVTSIEQMQTITNVPNKVPFIEGIIHLRGEVIPIIKLKERLSLGKTTISADTRILIVTIEGIHVGFIVDEAVDVVDLDRSIIQRTPVVASSFDHEVIKGVAKLEDYLLLILQLEKLFTEAELDEMKNVGETETVS